MHLPIPVTPSAPGRKYIFFLSHMLLSSCGTARRTWTSLVNLQPTEIRANWILHEICEITIILLFRKQANIVEINSAGNISFACNAISHQSPKLSISCVCIRIVKYPRETKHTRAQYLLELRIINRLVRINVKLRKIITMCVLNSFETLMINI